MKWETREQIVNVLLDDIFDRLTSQYCAADAAQKVVDEIDGELRSVVLAALEDKPQPEE